MKQGEAVADLNSGGKTRVQKQKIKVAEKWGFVILVDWKIGTTSSPKGEQSVDW